MDIIDLIDVAVSGKQIHGPQNEGDSSLKRKIESNLRKLSDGRLLYHDNYSPGSFIHSFDEWNNVAEDENDPDKIRALLYAIFQPLYDWLIKDVNTDSANRLNAVPILNAVIALGVDYLTGFYSGEPNFRRFQNGAGYLRPGIEKLADIDYCTKLRNIGRNTIFPDNITLF